ncbi:MAG: ATP-binding protein [Chthoniobacter sp.]|uniref:ATP-binding protein n=1 Tax=Chthoniobacter sp. TaxID=2510640 RepID=UPI0032AD4F67
MSDTSVPPPDVQRRLDALAQYQIMDTAPDPEFDALAARASAACETPMAMVTLLDDRRQWFKSRVGTETTETPIEDAFCAHTIGEPDKVTVVNDAQGDDRFRSNPLVTGGPRIRFYAGAPIVTPQGVPIGAVCVIDQKPRYLPAAKRALLQTFAHEAVCMMEAARYRRALEAEQTALKDLRLSEAYFRHLTEYALDLISILDADGTIRFESRSIERELGHSPAHYRGRNAFEFVHADDIPVVMGAFQTALEQQGSTPVIRFRFLHADGSYRILEGTGNNLLNDPAVRGIVFNSRDVTERVRLQEEVNRGHVEKEDAIARMTGGVAHDFNNILTAVQGLAELTKQHVMAGSVEAGYLRDIQAATDRAARLTQQLLAFSRRVVLQPCAIDLASWLRALEPRLISGLGPDIELTIVSHGELRVYEDSTQFEQVILQLAANARESMPNGGRFTIEAQPLILGPEERPKDSRPGAVNYVQLSVTDQGTGMDESTLARIFEPFFTTKTAGHHPGLGLCMCRGIIEQSGGHLTVHSHPGRGTVFHLFLPAAEAIEDDLPPPSAALASGVATILFVDDEPLLREIGATILLEAGFHVTVAEDGFDALAGLADMGSARPDLLITDVVMPGMTGVQLAEEVARVSPDTRILLCSGYTRDALAQSGGLPEGMAFLPKPYSLAALLAKVGELLNLKVV